MIRKTGLLFVMGITMAGAVAASTPIPVLFVMGCLILFALFITTRREQQG